MTEKPLSEIITANLRQEILLSGKSKGRIAREIDVAPATLSQYLSGRILPSLPTFARLCAALDCSADEILNVKAITASHDNE